MNAALGAILGGAWSSQVGNGSSVSFARMERLDLRASSLRACIPVVESLVGRLQFDCCQCPCPPLRASASLPLCLSLVQSTKMVLAPLFVRTERLRRGPSRAYSFTFPIGRNRGLLGGCGCQRSLRGLKGPPSRCKVEACCAGGRGECYTASGLGRLVRPDSIRSQVAQTSMDEFGRAHASVRLLTYLGS